MSDMDFHHVSVLLEESIDGLEIKPDGIYIDGTAGGAGHSREIAKRLTTGRLIALDKDPDAVEIAADRLAQYPCETVTSPSTTIAGATLISSVLLTLYPVLVATRISRTFLPYCSNEKTMLGEPGCPQLVRCEASNFFAPAGDVTET